MDETLKRLAGERESILNELQRNTTLMKQAVWAANERGYRAPTLAKLLGVTKRTVYLWLK
jgi:transposase